MNNQQITIHSARKTPWDRFATAYPQSSDQKLTELLEHTNLDYELHKLQLSVNYNGDVHPTDKYGLFVNHEGKMKMLHQVGKGYTFKQNMEIAHELQPLTEKWQLQCVGSLGFGDTILFTFKSSSFDIKGEPHESYFIYYDVRNGATSTRFLFTPVRVFCTNQLPGLVDSKAASRVNHKVSSRQDNYAAAFDAIREIATVEQHRNETLELYNAMADTPISTEHIEHLLGLNYPFPKAAAKDYAVTALSPEDVAEVYAKRLRYEENWITNQTWLRNKVLELYDIHNQQFPETSRTMWAFFNATTELADHRYSPKARNDEGYGSDILMGDRSLEKYRTLQYFKKQLSNR